VMSGQQAEESLQILAEPRRVARSHHVDRLEACVLAARQKSPEIQPRDRHQDCQHALLRLHTGRETNGEKQSTRFERCERAAWPSSPIPSKHTSNPPGNTRVKSARL